MIRSCIFCSILSSYGGNYQGFNSRSVHKCLHRVPPHLQSSILTDT